MTRVKICGLTRQEDAEFALECGADYLGFVFEPTSPRCVGKLEWAPSWISELQAPKVAVYGIYTGALHSDFDIVQAHTWDLDPPDDLRHFRVIRQGNPFQTEPEYATVRPGDALVLDSFSTTQHGGSGEKIDWQEAANFVKRIGSVRVILAGGLTPENVAEAVQIVRPFAVDVSSGVEDSPGVKSHDKLRAFIEAAKSA